MANPLPSVFTGPALAYPRRLDHLAERWARLPWRFRAALLVCLALTLVWWHTSRVNKVTAAMGSVQHVWVATETLTPGSDVAGKFKRTAVPGVIRPEAAVSEEPTASPVLTIVAGTVATSVHFDGVDKAPAVPAGHRAIAISTGDADLFSPGSRVDLWDLSEDEPTLLVEQLIVVSVKAQRVIVGVPDATASTVVQRASSNHIRVAPAGAAQTNGAVEVKPKPPAEGTDSPSELGGGSDALIPPTPVEGSPEPLPGASPSNLASPSPHPSQAASPAQHDARGPNRVEARRSHAQRVYKPP